MLSLVLLGLIWNIFAAPVDQVLVRRHDCPDIAAAAILSIFAIDVFASFVPLDRRGSIVDSDSVSDSDRLLLLLLLLFAKRSTGLHPVGSFPSFFGSSPPCDFPDSRAVLASRAWGAGGKVIAGYLGPGGLLVSVSFCLTHGSHTSSPSILLSSLPP